MAIAKSYGQNKQKIIAFFQLLFIVRLQYANTEIQCTQLLINVQCTIIFNINKEETKRKIC